MPADLLRRWPLLAALAGLGIAVPLWLGPRASLPPRVFFLHDQQYYVALAEERRVFGEEGLPRVPAPFAWRLLPSALVRASGLPPEHGFQALTLLTLALIPPAMAIMLSAAGASASSALMLGAVAALAPPVAGYLSWDFIRPDGLSLLLLVVCAWATICGNAFFFIAALVSLSLTKETWVISAAFALMWSRAAVPGFWKWALAGTLLALAVAVCVRIALPASEPYSFTANLRDLYWPLDPRTMARRLLLASAATWTVLTPLVAFALAARVRDPRAWAAAGAVAIATAQILVAIDTQRLVAAALPFVLLASAWELDRLAPRNRAAVASVLALAQLPWLLSYARVWNPSLRGIEVLLAITAAIAVVVGLRAAQPARSFTM